LTSVDQAKGKFMAFTKAVLVVACLAAASLVAQEAKVTQVMSKDLPNIPGKEGLILIIEYPPGSSDPVHRHNANGFIYVLEGSIVMQVRGGQEVTLTPGQSFYEGPDDVHVVGRNASKTKPAKFVVVFVKDKGAPVLVPAASIFARQEPFPFAQTKGEETDEHDYGERWHDDLLQRLG
jgi:quercetin dioxygenase-like cupin family protein